jgi:hypothetical protein
VRRDIFRSVPDLIAAIEANLDPENDYPRPFKGTATADQILAEVRRDRAT